MHYIGLVFVDTDIENVDLKLEPFEEGTPDEQYLVEEVDTDENGEEIVYRYNPNAKYDWYTEGGRWSKYIFKKDGTEVNNANFDDIDWEKMFLVNEETYTNSLGVEIKRKNSHHSTAFLGLDDIWREDESDYIRFDDPEHEKMKDEWRKSVEDYVAFIAKKTDEERASIEVYAIDFHI